MALHAEFRFGVRLFREPDAGNPPVRFDEREEETELSQTGLRRRGESPANRHREVNVTAPLLDSTQIPRQFGNLRRLVSPTMLRFSVTDDQLLTNVSRRHLLIERNKSTGRLIPR